MGKKATREEVDKIFSPDRPQHTRIGTVTGMPRRSIEKPSVQLNSLERRIVKTKDKVMNKTKAKMKALLKRKKSVPIGQ